MCVAVAAALQPACLLPLLTGMLPEVRPGVRTPVRRWPLSCFSPSPNLPKVLANILWGTRLSELLGGGGGWSWEGVFLGGLALQVW